jgi:hypothetical protein
MTQTDRRATHAVASSSIGAQPGTIVTVLVRLVRPEDAGPLATLYERNPALPGRWHCLRAGRGRVRRGRPDRAIR